MKLKGWSVIGIFVICACSEDTNSNQRQPALSSPPSTITGKVEYVSDVSSMPNQFYADADIIIVLDPKTLRDFWAPANNSVNSFFDLAKIQRAESTNQLSEQGWILTSLNSNGAFEMTTPDTSFAICLANLSSTSIQDHWMVEGCTEEIFPTQSTGS